MFFPFFHWSAQKYLVQNFRMIMFSQTFRIYEMLNKYFQNEDDARTLAAGIEEMVNQRFQTEKERLATKMDIMELKGDISQVKLRVKQSFKEQLKLIVLVMTGFSFVILVVIKILLDISG
jgi:hypothetical protein